MKILRKISNIKFLISNKIININPPRFGEAGAQIYWFKIRHWLFGINLTCVIRNLILLCLFGYATAQPFINNGYLNVNSNPTGLIVYLEGDSIGITPIQNYPLAQGEYSVSLFHSDTIESKYWNLSSGGIGAKYSALLDLSKVGAGTKKAVIKPNQVTEVFFSMPKINRAPTKVKLATTCCIGSGFSVAFLLGYWVAHLVNGN